MFNKLYYYCMLDKIKTLVKNPDIYDTRVLGLVAFGIVAVLVSWSGIKSIQTNYELQKQISVAKQQNEVTQLENDNIKLRNEYYKTDDFLELAARRQFGLAAPGEKVYIVPKSVALGNIKDLSSGTEKVQQGEEKPKAFYQQNLEAWFNFFLRKNSE